jgi:hypothetical protein
MKPSVGRIVHYVARGNPGQLPAGGDCRAAIIVEADGSDVVGVVVFNPTIGVSGQRYDRAVENDEEWRAAGTWHWPERSES